MGWQDVRFALRALRRDAKLSAIVIVLLGLGIGANAAIFSVADALLLRPPAGIANPDQVRRIYNRTSHWVLGKEFVMNLFTYRQYDALRTAFAGRASLAAFTDPDSTFINATDSPENVRVSYATSSFFPVLGVQPANGRFFSNDEDVMGNGVNVAVLSYNYWRRRFGGDAGIIGRPLTLGHRKFTVVGIASARFAGADLEATDMWLPLATLEAESVDNLPWYRGWRVLSSLKIVARVPPTTPVAWLDARGTAVLRERVPDNNWPDSTAHMIAGPALETLAPSTEPSRVSVITQRLVIFALLVMIIAVANVANLLLARAIQRRRDIAIRVALGMSRSRLLREIVLEAVVLSVFAGMCALAIAVVGGHFLRTLMMPSVHWTTSLLDLRLVLFTMALALTVGIIAGLLPALHATRSDLSQLLSTGPRAGGGRRSRLRTSLLVGQAALSLLLLVGAGLFVRSFMRLRAIDLGYDTEHLIAVTVDFTNREEGFLERRGGGRIDEMATGMTNAAAALRNRPGIASVALASSAPMEGGIIATGVLQLPDRDSVPAIPGQFPVLVGVSPEYFTTAGVRLVRGRYFSNEDVNTPSTMIINETVASLFWPGADPLTKCVILRYRNATTCRSIIGVVRDVHVIKVVENPYPMFYVPLNTSNAGGMRMARYMVVRTRAGASHAAEQSIREELHTAFPDAARIVVKHADEFIKPQLHPWRLGATLFSMLGLLALVIAALGVYSVVAYNVSQRTREIGVRVAIGATPGHIVRLILGTGLLAVSIGAACGVLAVFVLAQTIAPLLYQTSANDVTVISIAISVLLVSAFGASAIPAWRALRLNPADVLRAD